MYKKRHLIHIYFAYGGVNMNPNLKYFSRYSLRIRMTDVPTHYRHLMNTSLTYSGVDMNPNLKSFSRYPVRCRMTSVPSHYQNLRLVKSIVVKLPHLFTSPIKFQASRYDT